MRASPVTLLLATACASKLDPGLFAPTDDGEETDTIAPVDTDARDTARDTAPEVETDVETCRVLAVVTNGGAALQAFGVELVLQDRLPGAADDLSNVVVVGPDGATLPHWVKSATAGTGVIWAKVDLPRGDTTLTLDACDPSRDDVGRAMDVFPLYATFTDPSGISGTCSTLDDDETCEVVGEVLDSEPVLAIRTDSSCYSEPYDGAWGELAADVTLPPGQWRLDFRAYVSGSHDEFCSGATGVGVQGRIDEVTVGSHACSLSACSACDEGWKDVTSTPVAGDGGTHRVAVRGWSGDCAFTSSWVDDVWLHQVAEPAPRVRFELP